MKKIILVCLVIFVTIFSAKSQINQKYYFDADGNKTDINNSSFSINLETKNNYVGIYNNSKNYFIGKISKLDTNLFLKSSFIDTCKWFYKNGKEKMIKVYNNEGNLNGISKYYYESGALWKEYTYVNNVLENNTYIELLEDGLRYDIFEDDFSDNSSDWELMKNEQSEVSISNGKLQLISKNKDGVSRYRYLKFDKEDFILESKFEFNKNKTEDKGGLIYGFKDWNNYSFFYITEENIFIGTVYEGTTTYSVNDMFSNAINETGFNILKIISSGSDVVYTINGSIVSKSSKYNFYGNNFGVALLGKFTMNVDYITFKQLSYSVMGSGNSSGNGQQNNDVKATGTGFFINPVGYVATNFHVVESGKQFIVDVLDTNSQTYKSYKATVLIKDIDNDLAILKITDDAFKPYFDKIEYSFPATNNFELGSNAFTLGFPLALSGMGSSEVKFTDGKISAKTGYNGSLNSFQTTIPVQPGNSGGPIFNSNAELIGIINSKIAKADNVSYGIKNNFLINLVQSLPENITLPQNNAISNLSFEDKIKKMKKYIVLIRVK